MSSALRKTCRMCCHQQWLAPVPQKRSIVACTYNQLTGDGDRPTCINYLQVVFHIFGNVNHAAHFCHILYKTENNLFRCTDSRYYIFLNTFIQEIIPKYKLENSCHGHILITIYIKSGPTRSPYTVIINRPIILVRKPHFIVTELAVT